MRILLLLLQFFPLALKANLRYFVTDTTHPETFTIREKLSWAKDSGILIVVNGRKMASIRDIRKDITTVFSPEIIESITSYSASQAAGLFGLKENTGAIEFKLKTNITPYKSFDFKSNQGDTIIEGNVFSHANMEKWKKHMESWIYPMVAEDNGAPNGKYTSLVQFVVSKEGKISNIRPLTRNGYGMEEELIRAVLRAPALLPETLAGRPVTVVMTQPVIFQVKNSTNISTVSKQYQREEINYNREEGYTLSTKSFFAGKSNLLEIVVDGTSDRDIELELSEGTVSRLSTGRYSLKFERPAKVILTVWKYNKKRKKEEVGKSTLEVK